MITILVIVGFFLIVGDGLMIAKRRFTPRLPDHGRIREYEKDCYIDRDDPDPLDPLDAL